MNRPHEDRNISWCLTGFGDHLDCNEDDAQVTIIAGQHGGTTAETVQVCLTPETAYDLGMWLIAAASRIEERYPEAISKN